MDQNSTSNTNQPATTQPVQPQSTSPAQPVVSMRDTEPEHHGMNKGMALIIGLIIFAIIGAVSYTLVRNGQPGSAQNNPGQQTAQGGPQAAKIDATKPSLLFDPTATAGTYTVGQPITIALIANSQGADVYGYDIQFKLDKSKFEISQATSLLENFDIVQYDREEYYSITAIKDLNENVATPFDNVAIVSLTIVPKTAGVITLEVLPEIKGETSKFTDKDVKVIEPQIQPLQLEIRQ